MTQFKKQDNPTPLLYSKGMFIILCIGILLLSYSLFGMIKKVITTGKASQVVVARADALIEKKQTLEAEVASLDTDEGVEDILREKFPVVKEGERMVVIADEADLKSKEIGAKTHGAFVQFFIDLFR